MTTDLARLRSTADHLFEAIKHGDEKHQSWLREKLNEFFAQHSLLSRVEKAEAMADAPECCNSQDCGSTGKMDDCPWAKPGAGQYCDHYARYYKSPMAQPSEAMADARLDQITTGGAWRPIERPNDAWTYGWLYSPWENLCTPEELPGKQHLKDGDIRFGQPAHFTWATMIIPVAKPSFPAPPDAEQKREGE